MLKQKPQYDRMRIAKETPFSILVKTNNELAELRQEYSSVSASKRRMAADYYYYKEAADKILRTSPLLGDLCKPLESSWPDGYIPLAIDPKFPPVRYSDRRFSRISVRQKKRTPKKIEETRCQKKPPKKITDDSPDLFE